MKKVQLGGVYKGKNNNRIPIYIDDDGRVVFIEDNSFGYYKYNPYMNRISETYFLKDRQLVDKINNKLVNQISEYVKVMDAEWDHLMAAGIHNINTLMK